MGHRQDAAPGADRPEHRTHIGGERHRQPEISRQRGILGRRAERPERKVPLLRPADPVQYVEILQEPGTRLGQHRCHRLRHGRVPVLPCLQLPPAGCGPHRDRRAQLRAAQRGQEEPRGTADIPEVPALPLLLRASEEGVRQIAPGHGRHSRQDAPQDLRGCGEEGGEGSAAFPFLRVHQGLQEARPLHRGRREDGRGCGLHHRRQGRLGKVR